jgi:hypothetical protein
MSRVSADNQLPRDTDKTLAFALYAIFRAFARQINLLTDAVMAKATHSAAITGDSLVKTGQTIYRGFTITVVTAVGTIDIRDGIAAGGGVIIDTIPLGTAAGTRVEKNVGIICETGIYVDYNGGATGTVVVLYE